MADSERPSDVAKPASGQVTSKTPTTKPAKNPNRVAAGKATAEKTKLAREAHKKAVAEAAVIIENKKAKKAPRSSEPQHEVSDTKNVLNTTQWLTVISIVVSLVCEQANYFWPINGQLFILYVTLHDVCIT